LVVDGEGGLVVVRQKGLCKFDGKTGELRWEFPLGETWSPATPGVEGDTVFAASGAGKVFAIDLATGKEKWQWESCDDLAAMHPYRRFGKTIISSPRTAGEHLLIGSNDGRLVALEKRSGQLAWSHDFGAPVTSSPAICDGTIFLAVRDGSLYALKPA
jgi:outer membrane protein assembly factor BamB